ncbi:hypothetical protein OH492_11720 [Vibrio chagasii]|nr:hypothetical protein [Vibrio chagasii]
MFDKNKSPVYAVKCLFTNAKNESVRL